MKWASAIAKADKVGRAIAEACETLALQLGGAAPDLLLLFASPSFAAAGEDLPALVRAHFPHATLLGCSGAGVIGNAHEEEDLAAVSLVGAVLPEVTLSTFHVDMTDYPRDVVSWRLKVGGPDEPDPSFILLTDPFTVDAESMVKALDEAFPRSAKVGGLASGGQGPGGTRLFLGEDTWRSGAIGVALRGKIALETLVAQGCRPIGTPMLVTRCQGPVLLELNQRKPLEVLKELHDSLSPEDQALFRTSLYLGVEMRGDKVEYGQGDFLVRNLVGVDQRTNGLAVGTVLEPFEVVQFMVRDARAAEEDLLRTLRKHLSAGGAKPDGALLFTCVGRGRKLFGREDHDPGFFQELFGPVPLGGFFCNGEIGPVGGATYVHGYTSAFALFRAP